MTVLIAFASRHGATEEIAHAIGDVLVTGGLDVDVKRVADVDTVIPYEAFVVGSAVYMGGWLHDARGFLDEHAEILALRPTWLFSSGPVGPPPRPPGREFDGSALVALTQAREHHLFSGRLEKNDLGIAERAVVGALRVPEGDYREWDAVAAWATAIARVLSAEPAAHV